MREDQNNLRMLLKEVLDNLWSRAKGRFSAVETQIETITTEVGDAVKSISLNGTTVPKDAQGNVALTEADPTVPAWAKAASKPTYTAQEVGAIPTTAKGISGGVAELDSGGKVPSSQLPSYVDDVLAYSSRSAFPFTGETGKIYVANNTNLTYRWSGSDYVEISPSIALGETSSTAYRGDRGKTAYDHAQAHGSAFNSGLYKIATNTEGHVTGATAVQKSDITALGIPATEDLPTKTSDLTNDGDGASPFATEEYVEGHGGKIDAIKVNGTALPIVEKAVDIDMPVPITDYEIDEIMDAPATGFTTMYRYETEAEGDALDIEPILSVWRTDTLSYAVTVTEV